MAGKSKCSFAKVYLCVFECFNQLRSTPSDPSSATCATTHSAVMFWRSLNLIELTFISCTRLYSFGRRVFTLLYTIQAAMSVLLRNLRRSKKKAAKFAFTISCKELVLDCAQRWRPEQLVVRCAHRRRDYTNKPRRPDWSFDKLTRAIIAWPEGTQDPLCVVTTLFRDRDHEQYDDKVCCLRLY